MAEPRETRRVYSSQNSTMAYHVKNLLEIEGIECEVRREHLTNVFGLMPSEGWVEVWVFEGDEKKALEIVKSVVDDEPVEGRSWRCAGCGEELEFQFTSCWSCGADRESTAQDTSEE